MISKLLYWLVFALPLTGSAISALGHCQTVKNSHRQPVPGDDDQQQAMKLVRDVYADDLRQAATTAEKAALADKIFDQAEKTRDNPANRFALLLTAKDLAVAAGNPTVSGIVLNEIVQAYEIDSEATKLAVLKELTSTVRKAEQWQQFTALAIMFADEAMDTDAFDDAYKYCQIAIQGARRSRNSEVIKRAVSHLQLVRVRADQQVAIETARRALNEDPTDAEANLKVGKYACFVKGQWEEGIPMLALGTDDNLKALAVQELNLPKRSDEQLKLADGWWDFAEQIDDPPAARARERAEHWYRHAIDRLSGLDRVRVEKRLADSAAQLGNAVKAQGIVLWNTHNGHFRDRGTAECDVVLLYGDHIVWKKENVKLNWDEKTDPPTRLSVPSIAFDRLRVEIKTAVPGRNGFEGSGLTEIEVYAGDKNIAPGRSVRASAILESSGIVFAANNVVDGITQSSTVGKGYWLLPGSTGWIEIDFSEP